MESIDRIEEIVPQIRQYSLRRGGICGMEFKMVEVVINHTQKSWHVNYHNFSYPESDAIQEWIGEYVPTGCKMELIYMDPGGNLLLHITPEMLQFATKMIEIDRELAHVLPKSQSQEFSKLTDRCNIFLAGEGR